MAAQELANNGAEGFAVAVAEMLKRGFGEDLFRVRASSTIFNGDTGRKIGDAPVIRLMSWRRDIPTLPCLITIGDPAARRAPVAKVQAAGGLFAIGARIQGAISQRITIAKGTFTGYPAYVRSITTIGRRGMTNADGHGWP